MEEKYVKNPNIFEYDNYRNFLKDYYEAHKKVKRRAFSYRGFSRKAGFNSPNFLKLVMKGERNLTLDSIDKFIKAIGLNKEEAAFYANLVHLNQAKTMQEKERYAKQMMRSRIYKKLRPLVQAQYEYWANWYNVVIREMVSLSDFEEDPAWITRKLHPPISEQEAQNSLEKLLQLGFVKRNEAGRLEQAEMNITSGDEVLSPSISEFHRGMMEKGKEAIDRFPREERQISTLTFGISPMGAEKIKQMIQQFRKDLMAISNQDPDPSMIYEVNFQVFPLTEDVRKE